MEITPKSILVLLYEYFRKIRPTLTVTVWVTKEHLLGPQEIPLEVVFSPGPASNRYPNTFNYYL